jgi:hypothetical protein
VRILGKVKLRTLLTNNQTIQPISKSPHTSSSHTSSPHTSSPHIHSFQKTSSHSPISHEHTSQMPHTHIRTPHISSSTTSDSFSPTTQQYHSTQTTEVENDTHTSHIHQNADPSMQNPNTERELTIPKSYKSKLRRSVSLPCLSVELNDLEINNSTHTWLRNDRPPPPRPPRVKGPPLSPLSSGPLLSPHEKGPSLSPLNSGPLISSRVKGPSLSPHTRSSCRPTSPQKSQSPVPPNLLKSNTFIVGEKANKGPILPRNLTSVPNILNSPKENKQTPNDFSSSSRVSEFLTNVIDMSGYYQFSSGSFLFNFIFYV